MPIVIVRELEMEDSKCLINVSCLDRPYPQFAINGIGIRCFLNRVFTDDGKRIISQPRRTYVFKIYKPESYSTTMLDLSKFALFEGIPKDYYIETVAINFVYEHKDEASGKQENIEFPIYPREIKTDFSPHVPSRIREQISTEIESLTKIGEALETIGLLYQSGLHEMASDLTEGLLRVEGNDHEGAIKFLRKVVEGFRNYIKDQNITIVSEKRTEEMKRFLSTSYSLLGNFGEHTGTHGWLDEATFAKELAIATSRYILSTLK
jgi:hypothetical protein